MKKREIFDEENSVTIDNQKDDCFYSKQIIEYKTSAYPIEIQMRTLESSSEPPEVFI